MDLEVYQAMFQGNARRAVKYGYPKNFRVARFLRGAAAPPGPSCLRIKYLFRSIRNDLDKRVSVEGFSK